MANTQNETKTLMYKIGGGSWTTDRTIPSHVNTVGEVQEYLTRTAGVEFDPDAVINMNMLEDVNVNQPLVLSAGDDKTYLTWQDNVKKGGIQIVISSK
jgi:hypothetical protein